MYVLGISCFYHDSGVCLLHDGVIVGAVSEERFSRIKNDSSFPNLGIEWVLNKAGILAKDLDFIGFYEKPILKLDRILETYIAKTPKGFSSFIEVGKSWLNHKLFIRKIIKKNLGVEKPIIFLSHHQSHAASAFFASDFSRAAILTVDGVGEWSTTTLGTGLNNHINTFKEIRYPHSLGLLYGAFTYYLGFRINSDEYKVMGASSYGEPKFYDLILKNLIDVKEDGSFKLNMKYFPYTYSFEMINQKFEKLFGNKKRNPKDPIKQFHYDVAASIQKVTEYILLKILQYLYEQTKEKKLCMAGGVALNSVANGKILKESPFVDMFIQPAANDSGGAMGAAFYVYYDWLNENRKNISFNNDSSFDSQTISKISFNPYLGPEFSNDEIKVLLEKNNYPIHYFSEDELISKTANLLSEEHVIAWFQGKMEWGPRALGNRSILATPLNEKMRDIVNIKVKKREPFRPFAPVIIKERTMDFFKLDVESPFMLLVVDVKTNKIPAVTHVDNSARVQTVTKNQNYRYYNLIKSFGEITDIPILLNTSFNIAGEPLVCSPYDALRTFESTEIDNLILGNFILHREEKKGSRDLVIK